MIILDGKIVANKKLKLLKNKIDCFEIKPRLSIIQVGNIFESNKYISIKLEKASNIGITTNHIKLSDKIEEEELIKIIDEECLKTDGLIIQLPLPNHLDKQKILDAVDYEKDIDGLSSVNNKLLYKNQNCIFPATAKAIVSLITYYKISITDKEIAIIGESNLVGKPTKELFKRMGANVNSFNIDTGIEGSEKADILIVAAGSPNLVNSENIKQNAVIIDVGVNKIGNSNKTFGDVNHESVKDKAYAISPPIGGVGPLTVVSLLENLVEIYQKSLIKKL